MAKRKTCSYVDSNGAKCDSEVFDPFRKIEKMEFFETIDRDTNPPSIHCEEHLDRVPFTGRLGHKSGNVLTWIFLSLVVAFFISVGTPVNENTEYLDEDEMIKVPSNLGVAIAVLVSSILAFWLLRPIFSGIRFKNDELLGEHRLRDKEAGVKHERSSLCEGIDEDGSGCNQLVYWGDGICCKKHKHQEAEIRRRHKTSSGNSALVNALDLLSGKSTSRSSNESTIVSHADALTASWCPVCDSKMEGGSRKGTHYCPNCQQRFDENGVAY